MDGFSLRDSLLITAGARAAYMDIRGDINIPGGLDGEDNLSKVIVDAVRTYLKLPYEVPFDFFIEGELYEAFKEE